jgi:hypothetical protein
MHNVKERLPVYRHATALLLVLLLFCYVFFYSDVPKPAKQ